MLHLVYNPVFSVRTLCGLDYLDLDLNVDNWDDSLYNVVVHSTGHECVTCVTKAKELIDSSPSHFWEYNDEEFKAACESLKTNGSN